MVELYGIFVFQLFELVVDGGVCFVGDYEFQLLWFWCG